jgi:hypothetical protein
VKYDVRTLHVSTEYFECREYRHTKDRSVLIRVSEISFGRVL